ncbi:MAG: PAS domain-containing protein [Cytophagales bacterium]|nr:PAS domain-containing protein [Cytophagales bacterium]
MEAAFLSIQDLLDISGEFVVVTDAEGFVKYHTRLPARFQRYFVKPPEVGALFYELVVPERRAIVQLIVQDVGENQQSFKTETEFTDENGNLVFLSITFQPKPSQSDGDCICILIQDITQQKIFERKLSAQAKSIGNLIELAHAIIIGVDTRGYITDWNTHSARLTGYSKNEAYTKKIKDLLLFDSYKQIFEAQLAQSIAGKTELNFEVVMKCKSGLLLTVLVNITPRINTTGEVIGSVIVGHDVTELVRHRKTLEEKVQERNRELVQALKNEREMLEMKRRVTALASTDLYEPLLNLQMDVELLYSQTGKLAPEFTERVAQIEKRIHQLILVLDSILKPSPKIIRK